MKILINVCVKILKGRLLDRSEFTPITRVINISSLGNDYFPPPAMSAKARSWIDEPCFGVLRILIIELMSHVLIHLTKRRRTSQVDIISPRAGSWGDCVKLGR